MTKIQFWPADYFSDSIQSLVLSEPVAGQVRVTWQAGRGPDQIDLYVRQHATNWPTLDGTSGGTVDPAFKVGSFLNVSQALRTGVPTAIPDQTSSVWTNTGYTNGQIVRAIAIPRGQFGWTGARIFNSLTMQNAIGPALLFTGSGYLDDGLEDGLSSPGLNGTAMFAFQQLTRTSAVSNGGHDVQIEVLNFNNVWVPGRTNVYFIEGSFVGMQSGNGGLNNIEEAATVRSINVSLTPFLNSYPQGLPYTHLAMAIKLVPQGGGTPVDMLVAHYLWHTKLS